MAVINKKRVLFVLSSLEMGGAERVFVTLLNYLDRNSFTVELLVCCGDGPLRDTIAPDVPVHILHKGRVRNAIPSIVATIRKRRPHIVFSTIGHVNLALALVRPLLPTGTKVIVRETNIVSKVPRSGCLGKILPYLYRWLYPKSSLVVCQSFDMYNDLVDRYGLPKGKGVVVNNPVDTKKLKDASEGSGDAFPRPHFVTVGNLTRQKGVDLLIEAFARMDDPNAFLSIVGDGPERKSLEKRAKEILPPEKYCFMGFMKNPFPVVKKADYYVMSSRYEGFPNAVLEALALGVPVIAFSCPGGLDEIIVSGYNGVLVENGNIAHLARVMSDPGQFDRQFVADDCRNRFGVEHISTQYEKLFSDV